MDDTTQSRASDVASAATRKRRSSILKSQRPPRTPFCELEFNVATPTDTTKSRRVSFSRRTGVAEFVTNEATTTWKNFYEEHNKSLESSGNDSAVNHNKQTIAHLGKRIFDDQFEEVEADLMGVNPGMSIGSSLNNINFIDNTESNKLTAPQNNFELSAFTETQSKLFGNDLALPNLTSAGEVTDRIDVNFSAIQQLGENDDLDEIQKDVERQSNIACQGPFGRQNISEYIEVDLDVTHAAIVNYESDMSITDTIHHPKVQDVSKSCSIDKQVSLSNKDWVVDKENLPMNPYVAPRESLNFALNEEPDKVLVFDGKKLIVETEPKIKSQSFILSQPNTSDRPQRKTIVLNCNDDLQNFLEESQASKNSSHFVSDFEHSRREVRPINPFNKSLNKEKTIIYDDLNDISITQAIHNVLPDAEKRHTILYDENRTGNISMTQALPTNIIDKEKRRTVVFDNDNANISITQAVPNVLIPCENIEKRRTIVFENEACNISMTQAIPANIIVPENSVPRRTILLDDGTANVSIIQPVLNPKESKESRRTVVYEDNIGNISVTQSVTSSTSAKENTGRRTTVVFDDDVGNISVTQALPSNIISQKANATTYDNDANISMTQAVPVNILLANPEASRRRTVVFENGNLSITQAVPTNQVIQDFMQHQTMPEANDLKAALSKSLLSNDNSSNVNRTVVENEIVGVNKVQSNLKVSETTEHKRRTIVFQNDAADISITQAVPVRQVIDNIQVQKELNETIKDTNAALHKVSSSNKRRTVLFENDDADISMTQAVPINQVLEAICNKYNEDIEPNNMNIQNSKRKTHIFEDDEADVSMTQTVPLNQVIEANNSAQHKANDDKRRTVVFDNEDGDISVTQAVPMNKVIDVLEEVKYSDVCNTDATLVALHSGLPNKRRTVVFDNENADISETQAIPVMQVVDNILKDSIIEATQLALHRQDTNEIKKVVYENDDADVSMTEAVPMNQIMDGNKDKLNPETSNIALHKEEFTNKRKTIVFENEDANISMTEAAPTTKVLEIIDKENQAIALSADKKKTVVFDNENADISFTQVVPVNKMIENKISKENLETAITITSQNLLANKRGTVVFKNDAADISITQAVNIKEFLASSSSLNSPRHIITDISSRTSMRKSVASLDTTSKTKNIIYDDDEGDIVPSAVASSIILPNGQEKKRTIVVESVDSLIQNEDLFMDVDKDIDFSKKDKVNDDCDVSMTDVSVTEISSNKGIAEADSVKTILGNFIVKKDLCSENLCEKNMSLSKPIPKELASFQMEANKSQHKNTSNYVDSIPNTDILVYQSLTENTQNITTTATEKVDSQDTEEETPQSGSSKAELESENNEVSPKAKNAILNELLDMSESSYDDLRDKKHIIFKTSSDETPSTNPSDPKNSDSNMFYITKDSDEDGQIDKPQTSIDTISYTKEIDEEQTDKAKKVIDSVSYTKGVAIEEKLPLSIEYKDDDDPSLVRDTLRHLSGIKNVLRGDHVLIDHRLSNEQDTGSRLSLDSSKKKSVFKTANDTNELLDMISDFTDKRVSRIPALEDMREIEEESEPEPERASIKEQYSVESKLDTIPQPFTNTLKRQSFVLSREDLLNNMSMASAILRKSMAEYDDTESIDESPETPNMSEHKKSVTLGPNVVKQLQFDDDSISEISESNQTPLKKSPVVEVGYRRESRSKVIPNFLNVSDGIKELMDDLVKPTSDVVPFPAASLDRSSRLNKNSSKNSAEIQANLVGSSQIDLQTELYSATDSTYEMNKMSSIDMITDAVNRSLLSHSLRSVPKSEEVKVRFDDNDDVVSDNFEENIEEQTPPNYYTNSSVLIFDHMNPLNNVLLADPAPHAMDIHRYNPIRPIADPIDTETNEKVEEIKKSDDNIVNQYHVEFKVPTKYKQIVDKLDDQSVTSNTSKPMSVDQSTDPEKQVVKDTEINTVITMKGMKQLLQENSSLTLVDDALESQLDLKMDPQFTVPHENAKSPVTVIYQVDEAPQQMESDLTSTDEVEIQPQTKKRVYSPSKSKHTNCTLASLDVTPKPIAKLQKRSSPVQVSSTKVDLKSPVREKSPKRDKSPRREKSPKAHKSPNGQKTPVRQRSPVHRRSPNRQKSPRKVKSRKPGTTVTVQQLTTMIHQDQDIKTDSSTTDPRSVCASDILALVTSSEIVSSFNSSNNLREDSSPAQSGVTLDPSKADWIPESTSSFMVHRCDSVDLVAMIDALPFMGSHDCQWESVDTNVWTLLLLHSRLRLSIRFANTARLRPDTPVLNTELETLHQDKKNAIAYLCVLFAAEMMRYYMSRGCSTAMDVKKLVRRLAGASRLAAQWARAMHDARARLAYSLAPDGWLALKVANTSFRTVWEVTMRLELVMEDARAAPWPRACGVRVARVLDAAPAAPPPDVGRLLAATPRDWGHAPRTIWRVFRYLKHKKRDDSELHL